MKETYDVPGCQFANELISFVYGELSDRDSQQFKLHLNTCHLCSDELDSFGEMRDAISAWKYQSLAGVSFAQADVEVKTVSRKSATAALREFFELSPLWMKGAVGFATILFCILAVIATGTISRGPGPSAPTVAERTYTKQEVDDLVAKARSEAAASNQQLQQDHSQRVEKDAQRVVQKTVEGLNTKIPQPARNRRPLSRSERDQLAADLRLTTSRNDDTVDLIGDKINE